MQKSGAPLIGAFVGNKCDFRDGSLDSRAEVGVSEARAVAEAAGMKHFETSAVRHNILVAIKQFDRLTRRHRDRRTTPGSRTRTTT